LSMETLLVMMALYHAKWHLELAYHSAGPTSERRGVHPGVSGKECASYRK